VKFVGAVGVGTDT
jgi:hypothetical protein